MNEFTQKQIIDGLKDLSNPQFQKQVWVDGEGGIVSSPSELISQLFDDTNLADELISKNTNHVFSEAADSKLLVLLEKLRDIDLYAGAESLLASDSWQEIQLLAKQSLELIV